MHGDLAARNVLIGESYVAKISDFGLSKTIEIGLRRKIPMMGVCLGLQGLVEYYGGELGVLPYPMHGKPSHVTIREPRGSLFGTRGCHGIIRALTRCHTIVTLEVRS